VTHDGQVLESTFTCGHLAAMFDEYGQIEGELMGFVMRYWKIDSSYNQVYGSGERVVLSPHFVTVSEYLGHVIFQLPLYVQLFPIVCNNVCNNLQYVLDMDGLQTTREFDAKKAADYYRQHFQEQPHLARAYLVSTL